MAKSKSDAEKSGGVAELQPAVETATAVIDIDLVKDLGRITLVYITPQEHHQSLFRRLFLTLSANHATYQKDAHTVKHVDSSAAVFHWLFDLLSTDKDKASGIIEMVLLPDDGMCREPVNVRVLPHHQNFLRRLYRTLNLNGATYRTKNGTRHVDSTAGVGHWCLDQFAGSNDG